MPLQSPARSAFARLASAGDRAAAGGFSCLEREVVCNVANYEGPDQQKILDRFHAQYLELAAKLPVHVRYAVDGILNENDKKGFEEIEVERAAAERRTQERDIAASRERDGGWER